MLKLAELMDINIKYIRVASNASLMMSLSVGYPQILASGYPGSKFTIRFSPNFYSLLYVCYLNFRLLFVLKLSAFALQTVLFSLKLCK